MDDTKFIHGPFHIGDGQQVHRLWGEKAQKGKNSNKNGGGKRIGAYTLHKKRMCVCATILPLFQDNYPNCAPQGTPQDEHPPSAAPGRINSNHLEGPRPFWCTPIPQAESPPPPSVSLAPPKEAVPGTGPRQRR